MKTLSIEELNSIDGGNKVCDFVAGASIGFGFLCLMSVAIPSPVTFGLLVAGIACLS